MGGPIRRRSGEKKNTTWTELIQKMATWAEPRHAKIWRQ